MEELKELKTFVISEDDKLRGQVWDFIDTIRGAEKEIIVLKSTLKKIKIILGVVLLKNLYSLL